MACDFATIPPGKKFKLIGTPADYLLIMGRPARKPGPQPTNGPTAQNQLINMGRASTAVNTKATNKAAKKSAAPAETVEVEEATVVISDKAEAVLTAAGIPEADWAKVPATGKNGMVTAKDAQVYVAGQGAANKAKEAAEAARREKEEAKAKKEQEREAKRKEREEAKAKRDAERAAAREAKKKAKEEEAAKQAERDRMAFETFKPVEAESRMVKLSEIAPEDTAGAASSTGNSIAHLGAITAITLVERKDTKKYRYDVVDGARRVSDYRAANIEEVPAVVFPAGTDEKTIAASKALANMARSSNVIHEAEGLRRVMDETGWSMAEVARYFNIALPTVSKTLKVLSLPPDFYEAVRNGKIQASVAFELATLSPDQMEKARAIFKEHGTIKIKDVRAIRAADKTDAVEGVDDEAFESGEGVGETAKQKRETVADALANRPESVFEAAGKALFTLGLTLEDLVERLQVVQAATEEAEG